MIGARSALVRVHAKGLWLVSISATMITPSMCPSCFYSCLIVYFKYKSQILLKRDQFTHTQNPVWLLTWLSKILSLQWLYSPLLPITFLIFSYTFPHVYSAPATQASLLCFELARFIPTWVLFSLPEILFYRYLPSPLLPPIFALISLSHKTYPDLLITLFNMTKCPILPVQHSWLHTPSIKFAV